eukprot:TRINITY_DN24665_c0_g1_i1.p2 TRINITY_DN24665_c0_g1~~TRINITY_DN24665_c0_g1_i1.p2  ORF type:complete len:156 (-),score=18.52 TRINITY_DN24665_c0_g1_i1:640-1107(-)
MVASFFPMGLGMFHAYLLITNQTTYEYFKSKLQGTENPYTRGICRNIYEVCCFQTQAFEYQMDDDESELDPEAQCGSIEMSSSHTLTVTSKMKESQSLPNTRIAGEGQDIIGGNKGDGEVLEEDEEQKVERSQQVIMDQRFGQADDLDSNSSGGD